ncbi:MAG: hypothetical protein N2381_10805, partial [Armatimonadetes bacterium]|nr:hypothetical protein [Armatimonadota bacterium]
HRPHKMPNKLCSNLFCHQPPAKVSGVVIEQEVTQLNVRAAVGRRNHSLFGNFFAANCAFI